MAIRTFGSWCSVMAALFACSQVRLQDARDGEEVSVADLLAWYGLDRSQATVGTLRFSLGSDDAQVYAWRSGERFLTEDFEVLHEADLLPHWSWDAQLIERARTGMASEEDMRDSLYLMGGVQVREMAELALRAGQNHGFAVSTEALRELWELEFKRALIRVSEPWVEWSVLIRSVERLLKGPFASVADRERVGQLLDTLARTSEMWSDDFVYRRATIAEKVVAGLRWECGVFVDGVHLVRRPGSPALACVELGEACYPALIRALEEPVVTRCVVISSDGQIRLVSLVELARPIVEEISGESISSIEHLREFLLGFTRGIEDSKGR